MLNHQTAPPVIIPPPPPVPGPLILTLRAGGSLTLTAMTPTTLILEGE